MKLFTLDPRIAPSFLNVPGELLGDAPRLELVDQFLLDAQLWREQVIAWLGSPGRIDYLSEQLARELRWLLGEATLTERPPPPYRRWPLPLTNNSTAGSPPSGRDRWRRVLDVLEWRSRVVDYLADAWDIIGPEALEPRDCANAELLFEPSGEQKLCFECLQPLPSDDPMASDAHHRTCAVRRRRLDSDRRAGAPWTVQNPWEVR